MLVDVGVNLFLDLNFDIKKELAFSKGKVFLEWIREKIEKKFYGEKYSKNNPPVTFSDIKQNLIIYSVDLTNLKFKEFSSLKTPGFEIAKAIRASVSMPGLFTPLEIEDNLVVDGDLLKSTPLWRISNTIKNLDDRIIEFRLEDNEATKEINNSIEYLNQVYNAISGFATDYIIDLYKEKDKFDYIKINTPDISVVDFLIPKEKKQELYEMGYSITKSYFKDFYPQKKKILKEKYEKLLKYLVDFQKEFLKRNVINSYLLLCETFVFLCNEKRYLDMKLFEKLCCFRENFVKDYSTRSFLGFKTAKLSNKKEFEKELLEIVKKVSLKVQELS